MLNSLLKNIIKCYQRFISPFLTPSCRFHPTCSEYAAQALDQFGFLGALRRIVVRLSKCHPYHDGGYDPVK